MKAPDREKRNGLVGKYLHTFKDEKISQQGLIISSQGAEHFLVQWFSWLDGKPGTLQIFHISKMLDWVFYSTQDEMKEAWSSAEEGGNAVWAKGVQL